MLAYNIDPAPPEDAVKAEIARFVWAMEVWKLIAPVVGEISEIGLLSELLNSAFKSAAVNVSPASHVLILARANVLLQDCHSIGKDPLIPKNSQRLMRWFPSFVNRLLQLFDARSGPRFHRTRDTHPRFTIRAVRQSESHQSVGRAKRIGLMLPVNDALVTIPTMEQFKFH